MFEALALAAILTAAPGPDATTQPQNPDEVIGRQIDGPNGETYKVLGLDANGDPILGLSTASTPAPQAASPVQPTDTHRLAHTGPFNEPVYLGASLAFLVTGAGLVRLSRRGRA